MLSQASSDTSRPTVSVVIPNYNNAPFIVEAIESALAQTHAPHEVIVVDDGSTDNSLQVLERYQNHPIVQVLAKPNGGVSSARNAGAARATGEILAFLDADDIWLPHKTSRQLSRMHEIKAASAHCGFRFIDQNGIEGDERNSSFESAELAKELLLWERPVIISGSTTMMRRDVWQEMGGYDEQLSVSEDFDLSYRIARRYPVAFVPEALVLYRQHGHNISTNVERLERSMARFYAKGFRENDAQIRALKPRALANYHMTLAGSYWHARNFPRFFRHLMRSTVGAPFIARRLLAWPLRRLKRVLRQ